jgi:hypothetical protein
MGVTKTELREVITKLDDVGLELLRLRATLLREERVTARERRLIEQGRREIQKGRCVTLDQLRKELGVKASRSKLSSLIAHENHKRILEDTFAESSCLHVSG